MTDLGAYITQEYEILLRVFSFLPSKALISASKVCREWENVANRLILKHNKPFGLCKPKERKWSEEMFNQYAQPKVILRFVSCFGRKTPPEEFYCLLFHMYDMENVAVYDITNAYFIASDYSESKLDVKGKLGKNDEAFLILCDMPGVTIKCLELHEDALLEENINSLLENDPKCMISITSEPFTGVMDSVVPVLHTMADLYLAGGIAERPVKVFQNNDIPVLGGLLLISFHGENVEARLALSELKQDLEEFMSTLCKDVGPLPKGAIRMAFMFTCINRMKLLKDKEIKMFTKYFPDVPLYGLWSYGEYNYNALLNLNSSPAVKTRDYLRPEKRWEYVECTSYLIITLKRDT